MQFMRVNKLNTHTHTQTGRTWWLALFKLIRPRSIDAANEHSYNDDDNDDDAAYNDDDDADDDEHDYSHDPNDGSVDKVVLRYLQR